jgi:hypothetical protein
VFWVEFQRYRGDGGGGEGGKEVEVSLGVIMTNTEIEFHILLFTLSSSSVSRLKFHPKHVANKNKTKHIMKISHISFI